MKNYKTYVCDNCSTKFQLELRQAYKKENDTSRSIFCSRKCLYESAKKGDNLICKTCNKEFYKTRSQIKKSINHFCSRSCSVTYNNTHKTTGYRRSKLEKYIEEQLSILYPDLQILYNDKTTINSELDIYIPSLKLAFELNGIFHYEPIFGEDKLTQTQNNDERKFKLCQDNNISLCVIDTSGQKYFKPKSSQKFLNIITNIINKHIN